MNIATNMSNAEVLKLHGSLPVSRIEPLLDTEQAYQKFEDIGVEGQLREAIEKFPEQDFAKTILNDLRAVEKTVRGQNKDKLETIIEALEAKQLEIYETALEGVAILESIINEVEQI